MNYKLIKIKDVDRKVCYIHSKKLLETLPKIDGVIDNRLSGSFINKAYWLNDDYDWVLGIDDEDNTILVPLRKKL